MLYSVENLVDTGIFRRSENVNRTDRYEVEKDFELQMIHQGVSRLREAAEPVLEDAAADREARRLRSAFKVVEDRIAS